MIGYVQRHVARCLIAGAVALLPVGGTILLVVYLEQQLEPLRRFLPLYFPGLGLLAVALGIYLLGLTVTSFLGRWLWRSVDRLLESLPALGPLYDTLKQLVGYGSGEQAIFRSVVLVRDDATGSLELGLVTEQLRVPGEQEDRLVIFLPGAPNPAAGRLVAVGENRCLAVDLAVDEALKGLLSVGKSLPAEVQPMATAM
jgi:uncharacterized membrane protein